MNITMTVEGDSTERLVRTICAVIGGAEAEAAAPAAKPEAPAAAKPAAAPKPKDEPEAEPEPEPEVAQDPGAPSPAVSFEAVRKTASAAINSGKRDGVAALLAKYGDGTLKTVPEKDYAALHAEIEAL